MIVDHAIKCVTVPVGRGQVSSRYAVYENGNLIDCVYEYASAKMIVENRKEIWEDHE